MLMAVGVRGNFLVAINVECVTLAFVKQLKTLKNKAKNLKIIGVIPARFTSTRLPGKPLADICGKPMIWWVYNQACKSKLLTESVIATDDERIAKVCKKLKIPYIMTNTRHATGTDRVAEVAKKIPADIYINIQGDEPLIDPKVIDAAIKPMIDDPSIQVVHLMSEITRMHELVSTTVPNVVVNHNNEAMFFSRFPIPYPRNLVSKYFKIVAVYGFRPEALKRYASLPKGLLEHSEEIESLRFIENKIPIKMIEVVSENIAVDTPSDLEEVRKIICKKIS